MVLCLTSVAPGQGTASQHGAHPAVVRIISTERSGTSFGSGALVAAGDTYGLVVTNWHVVRDSAGPITVLFPDGFHSAATVLAADRDWDLAALAIWRPNVRPIRLATEAPRPGEILTIAGYGRGWYRAAVGRCTQYVSPGRNHPFEMVELDAGARQGDSGGPIFNQRGELAGVLFGAGSGRTTGSYCGRVRWFLDSVADRFRQLPSRPAMIAEQPGRRPASVSEVGGRPSLPPSSELPEEPVPRHELVELPAARPAAAPAAEVSLPADPPAAARLPGPSRADQIKTILAAIGILAILFHGLRILGRAAG